MSAQPPQPPPRPVPLAGAPVPVQPRDATPITDRTEHVEADRDDVRIEELPFGDAKAIRRFLDVAKTIYRGDPNYVFPLEMDIKPRLDPKGNPFFEHAEGTMLIATKKGQDVGRATAQIDHEHQKKHGDAVGFFGFLDTIDDAAVAKKLLDAAAAWLKAHGMKKMRGPLSLNINEEMGCLVEGFDTPPMILMPHHLPYQGGLIERAGLVKEKDVFAWKYEVGEPTARAKKAHDEVLKMPEVQIRQVKMNDMEREVRKVMDVFNDAWKDNWGAVPATESELVKMAKDLKMILVPELALIAEVDGEVAAISIALPNINEMIQDLDGAGGILGGMIGLPKLLWRLKVKGPQSARLCLLGIKKKFRTQKKYGGLSTALYVEMNERGKKLGVKYGELSWTLEDNAPVNLGIKMMGGKVYKRYRVYCRDL